jgi:hypothetical protein
MRPSVPDSINVSTWLSLRFERDTRYYHLHLEQDLWGAWILTRVNGRRNSRLGRALMTRPGSFKSGLLALAESNKRRRPRGYALVANGPSHYE